MRQRQPTHIKTKALILGLLPAAIIAFTLLWYINSAQLSLLQQNFVTHGNTIVQDLAQASIHGISTRDIESLETAAQSTLRVADVISVTIKDKQGNTLVHLDNPSAVQQIKKEIRNNPSLHIHTVFGPISLKKGGGTNEDNSIPIDIWLNPNDKTIVGMVFVRLADRVTPTHRQTMLRNIILMILIGLAATAAISLILSRQITDPLTRLTKGFDQLRNGNLDIKLAELSHGELRPLEQGFNAMAQELRNSRIEMQQEIDRATAELKQTMEAIEIQNVALDLARKRALEASKIKSEFLANVSHEIRTPINGVIGFSDLLQKTKLSSEQQIFATAISKSAQGLLNIINQVLDFSKLEAGKIVIEQNAFSIRECCDDAVVLLAPTAHRKQLELTQLVYDDVPNSLVGDSTRIGQILVNLVSNAIKFTSRGEITVRVMLEDETDKDCVLQLTVTDTGPGIPEQAQHNLFLPFSQGDTSTTRLFGGTGLGLSICRKLAESMNGWISVESKLGHGTCFQVGIKLGKSLNQDIPLPPKSLAGRSILLLDTHTISRSYLSNQLERWDMRVKPVKSLSSLVIKNPQKADLILMGLTGEDCRTGRAEEYITAIQARFSLPLLVLAGVSEQPVISKILQLGANQCISKPLSSVTLRQTLEEMLAPHTNRVPIEPKAATADTVTPCFKDRHFLVAEDNPINLQLMSKLLNSTGAQVTQVTNGRDAVDLAAAKHFDLILMDIHMPVMNGLQAAKEIRSQEPSHKHTPIVALTADAASSLQEQCRINGMDEFLTKPFKATDIWTAISRQLGIVQSAIMEEASCTARHADTDANTESELPLRDENQALQATGGKADLAENLLLQLLQELPQTYGLMQQQAADLDWESIWETTHRLHGATAICGVPALNNAVMKLELSVKNKDAEELDCRIKQVGLEIDRLQQFHQHS